MTGKISKPHHVTFDDIRHLDDAGNEYWLARQLSPVLDYPQWRNFLPVLTKAREACRVSGQEVTDHFADMRKMVEIGSGAQRELDDVRLSRYACYLVVQNGDPAKPVIANGQTYFALQTRRQELDHAIFQDHGYKGLYGGLGNQDIHARKGLKKSQKILDHMGSTELAANLFRATQAEEKLKRDDVRGKTQANQTHFEVGRKVRQTIQDLGGTMPEHLPAPGKSIRQLESAKKKQIKKTDK